MNIRNFRDISGYMNKDGKVMKKGMIFRGGALDRLTDEEAARFEKELGIKHILDFRDEQESAMAKDYPFPAAKYEQISALQVETHDEAGFDFNKMVSREMDAKQFQYILGYLKEGYKTMPFNNEAYRRLFELLLEHDGNLYFHCTAGKDRTGIGAFLIMMALGMSEDDGVKEYMLSNAYLAKENDALAEQLNIPKEYRKFCEPLLGVQEEFIRLTIEAIKAKYESYDEFLAKEYNLTAEKREKLVEIYCE